MLSLYEQRCTCSCTQGAEIAYVKEPNLSNKEPEPVEEEKRGLFGRKKKKADEPKAEETVSVSEDKADEVQNNIEK